MILITKFFKFETSYTVHSCTAFKRYNLTHKIIVKVRYFTAIDKRYYEIYKEEQNIT